MLCKLPFLGVVVAVQWSKNLVKIHFQHWISQWEGTLDHIGANFKPTFSQILIFFIFGMVGLVQHFDMVTMQ